MANIAEAAVAVGAVLVVGHPLAVLLHELGHAAVPLAASDARVRVRLGTGRGYTVALGRLEVTVSPKGYSAFSGLPGWFSRRGGSLDRPTQVATHLGGPAVTLGLLTAVLFGLRRAGGGTRIAGTILAYSLGTQAIATLVPIEYPGWMGAYAGQPSDGRRALDALRR